MSITTNLSLRSEPVLQASAASGFGCPANTHKGVAEALSPASPLGTNVGILMKKKSCCTHPQGAFKSLLVEPPNLTQNLEELENAFLLRERRVLLERVLYQLPEVLRLKNKHRTRLQREREGERGERDRERGKERGGERRERRGRERERRGERERGREGERERQREKEARTA